MTSSSVMVQALKSSETYAVILNAVPRTVKDALDCPPVQDLVNHGARINELEACLAVEIARIANLLTVGGNLRQGQSLEIARTLIADYPGESLQDFCLCLRNGVKGAYGDIFRFDILVINQWFKKYLEEKYNALEERLMKEKDDLYKANNFHKPEAADPVSHQMWLDKLKEAVSSNKSQVHKMTEAEIRIEGQEKPKPHIHPYAPKSYMEQRELHFQWIKENVDPYTGKLKPGGVEESEWLKSRKS